MSTAYQKAAARVDDLIRSLRQEGCSYEYIASHLGVGNGRIRDAISGGQMDHQRGRPGYSEDIVAFIESNTLLNARLTDSQMCDMVNSRFGIRMCRATVANIRSRLHFEWRHAIAVQELTPEQKFERVQFALELLELLSRGIYQGSNHHFYG